MKKVFLVAVIAIFVNAGDLGSILDYAMSHNELSKSKEIDMQKPLLESQSIKKDYYPKIDVGGAYQRVDPRSNMRPGDIYNGYAKISFNLFDGNSKKYKINAKKFEYQALKFVNKSFKKALQFNIVRYYFQIKSLFANLDALKKTKEYLTAEYKRVTNLYNAGTVTEDEVKKIEASLQNTIYLINEKEYQIEKSKKELSLYAGKDVANIGSSQIIPPSPATKPDTLDSIKILQAQQKTIQYSAKSLDAYYMPQVNLEDTYNLNGYGRTDIFHPKGKNHQNQFMLTFNIRLFDNDSVKKQKEAILVQKLSLQKQIDYNKKEQKKDIKLALLNIKTIKSQIESAKKSLEAANKAFELVSNRYHNGILTVVDYLDALSVKTNAMAQYKMALYNLQVAYATYYLYANKKIEEFIK